ncbi:MAG: GNAT family N-acetyltransferase [Deltaproteobacteria bacterium]|nr:GNAT family N-acetyltransferase [Myxococcales bacterium]MDP3213454.1 GNAT family N-acetyltransferase [Deltaproteobacteria bacterium]
MTQAAEAAPEWRLVALDPPDEAQAREIARFMRARHDPPENYPPEKDRLMEWKLRRNLRHPGFASAMMTVGDDRIVSLCTVTPKRLWAFGEEQPWAEIGDTFTDPAFQRRGMFSALVNATRERAQAAGFPIVFGLPNDQSAPGYTGKLNFPIKADTGHINCALPVSSRALAARLPPARSAEPWFPIAETALAHPVVSAASRALAWALLTRPSPRGVEVREVRSFGPEYDGLWARVRGAVPVAQVRDAAYLAWRFLENPFPFRVYEARRGGALAGYLVTLAQRDDTRRDLRRLYIVDWLFHPDDGETVGRALLQAALRPVLDEGIDMVTAQAVRRSPVQLPWKHFGFVQRPWTKPVIIHRNAEGARLLDDPAPWHFTLGDTDAF